MALYFCVGDLPQEEWRHYALNVAHYTHFTSPIRRYPDVLVHRLLAAALEGHSSQNLGPAAGNALALMPPSEVAQVASHCNDRRSSANILQVPSQRHSTSLSDTARVVALTAHMIN